MKKQSTEFCRGDLRFRVGTGCSPPSGERKFRKGRTDSAIRIIQSLASVMLITFSQQDHG